MDGAPRGRLLRYCGPNVRGEDPVLNSSRSASTGAASGKCMVEKGRIEVLLCGLHFPNGVQFTAGGNVLLVAETTRFRILKISMSALMSKGYDSIRQNTCTSVTGSFDSIDNYIYHEEGVDDSYVHSGVGCFMDALPGAPDNIRADTATGNIIIGAGVKSVQPFSLLYYAYQFSWPRVLIGKVLPMKYIEHLVPRYGLVLVASADGEAIDSYHDSTGRMSMVSEAHFHPETGDLWIGSHSNPFLGVDRSNREGDVEKENTKAQESEIGEINKISAQRLRLWREQYVKRREEEWQERGE